MIKTQLTGIVLINAEHSWTSVGQVKVDFADVTYEGLVLFLILFDSFLGWVFSIDATHELIKGSNIN